MAFFAYFQGRTGIVSGKVSVDMDLFCSRIVQHVFWGVGVMRLSKGKLLGDEVYPRKTSWRHFTWFLFALSKKNIPGLFWWIFEFSKLININNSINNTVDGRNPTPVDMENLSLFTGFLCMSGGCLGFLNHQRYQPRQEANLTTWWTNLEGVAGTAETWTPQEVNEASMFLNKSRLFQATKVLETFSLKSQPKKWYVVKPYSLLPKLSKNIHIPGRFSAVLLRWKKTIDSLPVFFRVHAHLFKWPFHNWSLILACFTWWAGHWNFAICIFPSDFQYPPQTLEIHPRIWVNERKF